MKSKTNLLKLVLSVAFFGMINGGTLAQVGINTTNPKGVLDINSSTQGVVLPVVALTANNVEAPVTNPNPSASNILAGTVVYNTATTTNGSNDVVPGMYVWDGSNWIPQFPKRQHYLDESSLGFRTRSNSSGTRNTTIIGSTNFTADFTGRYLIRVRANFGGGGAETPDGSASEQYLNVARQDGTFQFQWDGTYYDIPATTYSTAYNGSVGATNYFAIWQEFSSTMEVTMTAGETISYLLRFAQEPSPEFVGAATSSSSSGRAYIAYDIPCTVEITYVGE